VKEGTLPGGSSGVLQAATAMGSAAVARARRALASIDAGKSGAGRAYSMSPSSPTAKRTQRLLSPLRSKASTNFST
jgi:hypothetical protein